MEFTQLTDLLQLVEEKNIPGIKEVVPLEHLPPEIAETFFYEDQKAALIPLTFESDLDE